ncbi:SUMF1/EgtB/PvdO family nonheme iron enzyme [Candidatus Electronema sp. TJ]|uniref:SUMF1/EgtB/PvdO family nonheme iron enzyme n=1 Tax=Candidatus Electronema sp. TJ TaxID=3401573 RepID=UPI003AA97DBF
MAWQQKRRQLRTTLIGLMLLFSSALMIMNAAASGQTEPPDFGKYYALVIGNQSYRHLEELTTARADAKEIAKLLEERYGFEVELLLDGDRERMLWTLSQLPKRTTSKDRDNLLIYYAGHGQLDRNGAGRWLPVDAEAEDESNGIPTSSLTDILSSVQARHILVLSDSVYSASLQLPDNARLKESREERLRRLLETPSLTALTSGSDRPMHEAGAKHSLFARNVLISLRDNRDVLSGRSLFGRLLKPVYQSTELLPRYGHLVRTNQKQGDFLFATRHAQNSFQTEPARPAQAQAAPPQQQAAAPPLPQPKQGDALMNEAAGMEFVYVPGGCFKMGSPVGEKGRFDWEGPEHEVCVNGFWMSRYEVTQEQWLKIMGSNPSSLKKNQHPVENVSWHDAQEFLARLNKRSGRTYRLPTEAEWEYACRAGGGGKYCGSDNPDAVAWHEENSSGSTRPAGRKQANAFGLHDMSGNVWEWCADKFDKNYYAIGGARNNPRGPADGDEQVVRGGSAGSRAHNCRAAFRFKNRPDYRENLIGFRVVMQQE